MTYDVTIRHAASSGDGISIEAEINGDRISHTFPKGMGFLEREGVKVPPKYVQKLIELYEKRKRSENLASQALNKEEKALRNGDLINKEFSVDRASKGLKNDDKQNKDIGENVNVDDPESIRKYLKDNMAGGYLSDEEEENIDKFVDSYSAMLSEAGSGSDKNIKEALRKAFEGKVQ